MKFLVFYFLVLSNFSFAKIECISYYFIQESVELTDSSLEEIQILKNSIDLEGVQLIELNLFYFREQITVNKYNLTENRAKSILDLFNLDNDIVSINFNKSQSNLNPDSNRQNRIDIYINRQSNFECNQHLQKENQLKNGATATSFVDPRTITCLKQNRKADLNYIVKGVPILIPIEFEGNNARKLAGHDQILFALRDKLNGNMQLTAHIRGHVCCGGNMRLSRKRAKMVYQFLIEHGINSDRLSFKGYSNTVLLVPHEQTDADRKMNRRVDIIFN